MPSWFDGTLHFVAAQHHSRGGADLPRQTIVVAQTHNLIAILLGKMRGNVTKLAGKIWVYKKNFQVMFSDELFVLDVCCLYNDLRIHDFYTSHFSRYKRYFSIQRGLPNAPPL